MQGLAAERHRHLSAPEPQRAGRDPEELEQEAAELRAQEKDLAARLAPARQQLTAAVASRTRAEAALAENERRLAADAKAAAQRAEQLARLRSQVESATSRANAAQEEAGRLAEALAQARARAEQAQVEYAALQDLVSGREEGRADLAAEHEQAAAADSGRSDAWPRCARPSTPPATSARRCGPGPRRWPRPSASGADASGVLLARPGTFAGVLGPLAELLTVQDGAQEAIAAALGAASGAVVVAGLDAAVAILTALRRQDAGRAGLVIGARLRPRGPAAPRLPDDIAGLAAAAGVGPVPRAVDLVTAPPELRAPVAALLGDVLVCLTSPPGSAAAGDPRCGVVTRDGDVLGAHWAQGGSAAEQSLLSLQRRGGSGRAPARRRGEPVPAGRTAARRRARGRGAGPAGAGRGRCPAARGRRRGGRDVGQAGLAGRPGQGGQG